MLAFANDPNTFPLILTELIGSTLLVVGLCVPLVRGPVEMNGTYGIRTKKAFKSKENWDAINKFGGKALMICALCMGLVFVPLAILFRHNPDILLLFILAPVFYIIPGILIHRYGSKLP